MAAFRDDMPLVAGVNEDWDEDTTRSQIVRPDWDFSPIRMQTMHHLLPVKFPAAPVLLSDGPPLSSWQVAVVRVDETPAGDASGRKCPRAEQNRQRPIDVSEVTGNFRPVLPAKGSPLAGVVNPAGPDGPVVAGGPVGPCEMPSPYSEKSR